MQTLNVVYGQATQADYDNASAVDALDVHWLGGVPKASERHAPYRFVQPANATRVQNRSSVSLFDSFRQDSANEIQPSFLLMYEAEIVDTSNIENRVGLAYGVGTLGSNGMSDIQMEGSVIGRIDWTADFRNQIIGPKSGVVFQRHWGRWSFDSQAIATVGANFSQSDRKSSLGRGLIPGALNQLLYGRQNSFAYESTNVGLSPAGVLHATLYYDLTESITLRTAWSSLVLGNLLEIGDPLFRLPDGGFTLDLDTYTLHQIFCGVEYKR